MQPRKPEPKTTDFLKEGHDQEFQKAMSSINNMYDDLFKTTDYQAGNFDMENVGKFDSIENMWNDIMDVKPSKKPEREREQEIVVGEPVYDYNQEQTGDNMIKQQRPPKYLEPIVYGSPVQQASYVTPNANPSTRTPIYRYEQQPTGNTLPPNPYVRRY